MASGKVEILQTGSKMDSLDPGGEGMRGLLVKGHQVLEGTVSDLSDYATVVNNNTLHT